MALQSKLVIVSFYLFICDLMSNIFVEAEWAISRFEYNCHLGTEFKASIFLTIFGKLATTSIRQPSLSLCFQKLVIDIGKIGLNCQIFCSGIFQ